MTRRTEAVWAERVREWRASGQSADDFARGKAYRASTLRWAASRLAHGVTSGAQPARARRSLGASPPMTAPRLLPLIARPAPSSEVIVEVGVARVRVARGFDRELLGDVLRVLGEATR